MGASLKLGNDNWATKEESLLAYNDENGNYKPLPFSFSRASNATVVNEQGLIELVGSDEPRIDFKDNTKGSLLLEPQSTNLVTYSEDFSQWVNDRVTVSENQIISPNGTLNADLIAENSEDFIHRIYTNSITLTDNVDYTITVFAKKGNSKVIQLTPTSASVIGSGRANFDLENGVLGLVSGGTAKIKDYGNGWYRCSYSFEPLATAASAISVNLVNDDLNALRNVTYLGNINNNVYLWGAQLEVGSYATSYIPTNGSAVTRVAEQGINGGAGVPIFSNTSAVWFIDLERNGVDTDSTGSAIALRNSSFSEQIRLHFDAPATDIRFRDGVNGFATISTITGANPNVRKKLALRIDGSTLSTFSNGIKIGSDYTAPNVFDLEEIDFSSIGFKIHDMRAYNTALTDQELITLTTI